MAIVPAASPDSSAVSRPIPRVTRLLATGLFTGYIPGPSGTWGSLLAVAAYALIPGLEHPFVLFPLSAVLFFAGAYASGVVADRVGHQLTQAAASAKSTFQGDAHAAPDPSIVVIDEIVGMWATLLFLPKSPPVIVLAFILFRFYDIVKPFPARRLERIRLGWGIMLDDLVAAVYANISCRIILLLMTLLFPHLSGR